MTLNNNPNTTNDENEEIRFEDIIDNRNLLKGIFSHGWYSPSEIQVNAIPKIIKKKNNGSHHDVIAQSQSGTGKTGTFLIGSLYNLELNEKGTQVVIISPTRELATQTKEVCSILSKYLTIKSNTVISELFIGGTFANDNIKLLKDKDVKIAIGTPGRLFHMMKCNSLKLDKLITIVLDEADELFRQGFKEQIYDIFKMIPNQNQNQVQYVLFSATYDDDVKVLSNKFLRDPYKIMKRQEELSLKGLAQYKIDIDLDNGSESDITDIKFSILEDLYKKLNISQCIIFCNTKIRVNDLEKRLKDKGFPCGIIHGEMPKQERDNILLSFREGKQRILISTDVLSRGIDVQHVSIVMNFDVCDNKENFLHRCGRAGRYGRIGAAISLVSQKEKQFIENIESHFAIDIIDLPDDFVSRLNNV